MTSFLSFLLVAAFIGGIVYLVVRQVRKDRDQDVVPGTSSGRNDQGSADAR